LSGAKSRLCLHFELTSLFFFFPLVGPSQLPKRRFWGVGWIGKHTMPDLRFENVVHCLFSRVPLRLIGPSTVFGFVFRDLFISPFPPTRFFRATNDAFLPFARRLHPRPCFLLFSVVVPSPPPCRRATRFRPIL